MAGANFDQIANQLALKNGRAAELIYNAAMKRDAPKFSTQLEGDRLDRMHMGIWPKARDGDLAAVDRVLKISERREQLFAVPKKNDHALRTAFDESANASVYVLPTEVTLPETGRKIADQVDEAVASGEGQEITKALCLLPHLNHILREMLATPASRKAAGLTDRSVGGHLARLRAVKTKLA
jgi:hypothetical protein